MFQFDCGNGRFTIRHTQTLTRGTWYTITATRSYLTGSVEVDGHGRVSEASTGEATLQNLSNLTYIGGLPIGYPNMAGFSMDFQGCIELLQVNCSKLMVIKMPFCKIALLV